MLLYVFDQGRLYRNWADSSEPSLLPNVISSGISCIGLNDIPGKKTRHLVGMQCHHL